MNYILVFLSFLAFIMFKSCAKDIFFGDIWGLR